VAEREPAPRTARARARAELTREIVETARAHLSSDGAAGLSLRAVARDLGMVSSAIYRYFPSRDELLTALIIDAYNSLGDAAEQAESSVKRTDLNSRWTAIARASRTWALAHPHEWALIYGSPVPGYQAPQDTIAPATRVSTLLIGILVDVQGAGMAPSPLPVPRAVHTTLGPVRAAVPAAIPDDLIIRGLMAWTQLIGAISMELNGQFHNVVSDTGIYFDLAMQRIALNLGID
jgi:AcrR family transcriptional regulator